jgi:glycosyltransferase involved in cell wall biosynthesis
MASEQVWVVAACFNEAEVISAFIERVVALPDVDHLLLIDDGSSDATVAVIRGWQQSHNDQGVTLLELTRNFGKEAAMLAGLDYVNSRCGADRFRSATSAGADSSDGPSLAQRR